MYSVILSNMFMFIVDVGARDTCQQQLRGGAPPFGSLPRAGGGLRGVEAGVGCSRDQYGGVPTPAALLEATRFRASTGQGTASC